MHVLIVDATLTDTLRCLKGKAESELAEDRKEDEHSVEDLEKEEVQKCIIVLITKKRWVVYFWRYATMVWLWDGTLAGLAKTHTQQYRIRRRG